MRGQGETLRAYSLSLYTLIIAATILDLDHMDQPNILRGNYSENTFSDLIMADTEPTPSPETPNASGKIPATPEGMMVAYGSLVIMALIPIFLGSFRSVDSQREQKENHVGYSYNILKYQLIQLFFRRKQERDQKQ